VVGSLDEIEGRLVVQRLVRITSRKSRKKHLENMVGQTHDIRASCIPNCLNTFFICVNPV
jgi:hypothetical protein